MKKINLLLLKNNQSIKQMPHFQTIDLKSKLYQVISGASSHNNHCTTGRNQGCSNMQCETNTQTNLGCTNDNCCGGG